MMRILTAALTISLASPICSAAPLTILTVGDSTTVGIMGVLNGTRLYSVGGYRVHMAQALAAKGIQVTFTGPNTENQCAPWDKHAGYPGFRWANTYNAQGQQTAWGLLGIMDAYLPWIGGPQPDIIIIWAGINDVSAAPADSTWQGTATLQSRAWAWITAAHDRRPSAKIILVDIPRRKSPHPMSGDIAAYSASLPAFAAQLRAEGLPVTGVRIYPYVPVGRLYDEVHLDELGYQTVGERLADNLSTLHPGVTRLPRLTSAKAQGDRE